MLVPFVIRNIYVFMTIDPLPTPAPHKVAFDTLLRSENQ